MQSQRPFVHGGNCNAATNVWLDDRKPCAEVATVAENAVRASVGLGNKEGIMPIGWKPSLDGHVSGDMR